MDSKDSVKSFNWGNLMKCQDKLGIGRHGWMVFFIGVLITLILGVSSAWSVNSQINATGYVPRQTYDTDDITDINLYNLNLVLSLPLTQTYPVNDRLSYSLTAHYNGGLQWSTDSNTSSYGASAGNPALHGWVGAGWKLDFGKVTTFIQEDSLGDCVYTAANYISQGGGIHILNSTNYGSTTDGSDLRIEDVELIGPYGCQVPTRIRSNPEFWLKTFDPNTGQAIGITATNGSDGVSISYMLESDFLQIDPNAPQGSYDFDSPWPEVYERTLAIKQVSDSHGRSILTEMELFQLDPNDQSEQKFLLKDLLVPVFGDDPNIAPTGNLTFHYEARTINAAPPGWPPFSPPVQHRPFPYLVRVELPPDGNGDRVNYVFDYNAYGELSEVRTPKGGLIEIIWDNEYVDADDPGTVTSTPLRRVVREKRLYPDPYGSPSTVHAWTYEHNPYPETKDGSSRIFDTWRTLVTDPYGNESEYRFYTTEDFSWSERSYFYPRGLVGAIKYFKGPAERWKPGAQNASDPNAVDPNAPTTGELIRGIYYRYERQDPNQSLIEPVHVEGVQTVFYDDPLTVNPTPHDPESASPGVYANYEMEFDLTPLTGLPRPAIPEGWATHIVMHDPERWRWGNFLGTQEDTVIHKGNLAGGKEIRIQGSAVACDPFDAFGGERSVWVDGNIVEFATISDTGSYTCIRRNDPNGPSDPNYNGRLLQGDTGSTYIWEDGFIVWHGEWVASPYLPPGQAGSYAELFAHAAGVLAYQEHSGLGYRPINRGIDIATGRTLVEGTVISLATWYTYDSLGRLTSITPPGGDHSTTLEYPTDTGLQGVHRFSREVVRKHGPDGDSGQSVSRTRKDGFGRTVAQVKTLANGSETKQEVVVDGLGNELARTVWHDPNSLGPHPASTTSYTDSGGKYDPFGRPSQYINANGEEITFAHFGLNTSQTVSGINAGLGDPNIVVSATTTQYRDYQGNVRVVVSPEGAHGIYDYDHAGRLTSSQLPEGLVWDTYDEESASLPSLRTNRFSVVPDTSGVTQSRVRTFDALGRLSTETNPERGTDSYWSYDAHGNPIYSYDSAQGASMRIYDGGGRLLKVYAWRNASYQIGDPLSLRTEYTYTSDRLFRIDQYDGELQDPNVTAVPYHEKVLSYDSQTGRLEEEAVRIHGWLDPNSPWIRTEYERDAYGRPAKLRYPIPDGSQRARTVLKYAYGHGLLNEIQSNKLDEDPNTFSTMLSFGYDSRGFRSSLQFANGVTESWARDQIGRVYAINVSDTGGTIWDSGIYEYDGAGNLVGIGALQDYSYDELGRLKTSTTKSPSGPLYSQSYQYTSHGAMSSRDGYEGASNSQQFQIAQSTNRLTKITSGEYNRNFTYLGNGAASSDGVYHHLYNDLDQLKRLRFVGSGVDVESYMYDGKGLRSEKAEALHGRTTYYLRGPDGRTLTEYAFPTNSSLEPNWKKDYVYAEERHIGAVVNEEPEEPTWWFSEASDPNASPWVTVEWLASPTLDAYGYNVYRARGTSGSEYFKLNGPPLVGLSYTDNDPNLIEGEKYFYKFTTVDEATVESRLSDHRKIVPGDGVHPGVVTSLSGDWVGTSVGINWTEPSIGPQSDIVGYRIYRRVMPEDPNVEHDLLTNILPAGTIGYIDSTVVSGTDYKYEVRTVDTANNESLNSPTRVVEAPGGGGPCLPFPCLADGILLLPPCRNDEVGHSEGRDGESFCFATERALQLAGQGGGAPSHRVEFYHTDHLGTPRVITDDEGNSSGEFGLFPFGDVVPGSDSMWFSGNTHWFTGHERDMLTGVDYMLARRYLVGGARFVSVDPVHDPFSIGRSGGRYGYVYGNPLRLIDPDGMDPCDPLEKILKGAVLKGILRLAKVKLSPQSIAIGVVNATIGEMACITKTNLEKVEKPATDEKALSFEEKMRGEIRNCLSEMAWEFNADSCKRARAFCEGSGRTNPTFAHDCKELLLKCKLTDTCETSSGANHGAPRMQFGDQHRKPI